MNINDVLNICKGELLNGNLKINFNGFSKDTRSIEKGNVYVGIKGENFDGNKFYKEAFNKGASLCILDNASVIDKDNKLPIILVDDSIDAITKLAKYKRSLYDIPVIAITGSVGKTSVKDMITAVLSTSYKVLSTKGNMNNHIGVPLTILNLDKHDALVIEMGMNHFNELHNLSMIANPTMAVITNIGTAHIGNLGSRENILKAKLEILDGIKENGILFINNDNALLHTVKYDNLVTIGINNKSDYMAKNISIAPFKASFKINDNSISIPIGNLEFIYNSLFAYAVGNKLGIDNNKIVKALKDFKLTPHRLEVINCKDYTIIDDTYNASLDSIKSSLSLLSKIETRKVFIFGDILETGDFEKEIHKNVADICIDDNIDLVICVGKLSLETYNVLKNSKFDSYHFNNNDELIKSIDKIINKGDTILIKGSHAMNLIEIVNYLKK